MQVNKMGCLYLTVDEARERLVDFYVDTIVNDRSNVLDHVRDGTIGDIVPNVTQFSPKGIAELVAELNLAEKDGLDAGVGQVFVALDNKDEDFTLVWDYRNMEDTERVTLPAEEGNVEIPF